MITIQSMGGIGNQLFQLFSCAGVALDNNLEYRFNTTIYNKYGEKGKNMSFVSTLFYFFLGWDSEDQSKNHRMNEDDLKNTNYIQVNEPVFSYSPVTITNPKSNYLLYGYYQSPKYFEKHKDHLFKQLNINYMKKEIWKKTNNLSKNLISIHFRIGDYKEIEECHPIMPKSYYLNALKYIEREYKDFKNSKIVYFYQESDKEDVLPIINKLKEHFKNEFIPVDSKLEDWEQLILMSCCRHNIIANSTFSWWGAYFNNYSQKIVCYPNLWFGPKLSHETKDLFPENWNSINVSEM